MFRPAGPFGFALLLAVGLRRRSGFRLRHLAAADVGDAERGADFVLDPAKHLRVILQGLLRVLAPLPEPLALVGEPRAALLDGAVHDAEVDHVALARDALAVHDVELALAEGRRDLVLDDFDLRAVAHHSVAVLDGADAADVGADRGVELERAPAGRRLRAPEHDADLLANLVDED